VKYFTSRVLMRVGVLLVCIMVVGCGCGSGSPLVSGANGNGDTTDNVEPDIVLNLPETVREGALE
jgi:hypothetical protein